MIRVGEINKFCDENSKILEQSTFICSYVNKIFHSSVPFSVFIWWFAFFRYEKRDIFPDYKKLIIKQITLCVYMIKLLQFDEKIQEGRRISLWYSVIRYKKASWHFSFFEDRILRQFFRRSNWRRRQENLDWMKYSKLIVWKIYFISELITGVAMWYVSSIWGKSHVYVTNTNNNIWKQLLKKYI